MRATTVRSVPRWYVTAPAVQQSYVDGCLVIRPAHQAHAKRMGTMTTACGLWAYAWRKLFDLQFPMAPCADVEMCPACLAQMIGEY